MNPPEPEPNRGDQPENPRPPRAEIAGIEVLFEVVSRLRIVLDRTVNVTFGSGVAPIASAHGRGVLKMEIIDHIESHLRLWNDGANDRRYIVTLCNDTINFSSADDFLSAVLKDYRAEKGKSCTVLREPKTQSVSRNSRCYDPEALGFPYSEIIQSGIIDDQYRIALDMTLQGAVIPGGHHSFLRTASFEYPPRGNARHNVLQYAIGNSERIVDLFRRAVAIHNSELGLQDPDVRNLSGFETVHPTYEFNAFQGLLDAMPRAGYVLRYELVTALSGFSATLTPAPTGDLMKSAGANAVKASFLADVTTTTYHDEMGPEIASLLASYVVPGEVLIDLDLSDIPDPSRELRAVAAMGALMLLMYDENSTFTNTTEASITMIQRAIVGLGIQGRVFRQHYRGGPWPLDDVMYYNGPADGLDGFRVIEGMAGINQGNVREVPDRLLDLFPGCGGRINYAIDFDDYHAYSRDIHGPDNWNVYTAISNFLGKLKATHLTSYFNIIAKNIQDFFVRINEHNKTHWYHPLRNHADVQRRRNAADCSRYAIRSVIKGKTVLHLMRSLNGRDLIPAVPFEDILHYSSGVIRIFSDLAVERTIVERMIYDLGILQEYRQSDILKILCNGIPLLEYILEVGRHYNELGSLSMVSMAHLLQHDLTRCFEPLYGVRIVDLIPKSVLPRIVARLQVNRITRGDIDGLINRRAVYMNVYDGDCEELGSRELKNLIENRAFRYTLHASQDHPIELGIPVPFRLSYSMEAVNDDYCIRINAENQNALIRTRVEIKEAKVHVLSFDVRDYRCLDDYTPKSTMIQTNFVRTGDIANVIVLLEDFFNRLGGFSSPILVLCNARHSFVDV